jgi:bifunctional non-homologous end joining protein LigD
LELGQSVSDEPALLDGEIVVLREDGISDFQQLQNALGGRSDSAIVYYAFDLLHFGGYDLCGVPLEQRKLVLAGLLQPPRGRVRYSDHLIGGGPEFFGQACARGLEGIISKRRSDPYRSGRTTSWLKSKCVGRQEFVIVGFSEPSGSREHIGALLLGVYEGKTLRYVGRVGTGFSQKSLTELKRKLAPLEGSMPPLANPPRGADARGVHWVRPALVAERQVGPRGDSGTAGDEPLCAAIPEVGERQPIHDEKPERRV